MTDYKNILIVRTDRIGDVVLTTPAIKALREAYPNSKIAILVALATRDLVDGNICLDKVLVDDRDGEHKGLRGFIQLIRSIRKEKFDCAFVLHTKKRTNLTCFLSGIPVRIGYKNSKFGFLLNRPITDVRHKGEKHEAQYCLDVLKKIGIECADVDLDLPVKEDALCWVDQFRREHNISENDRLIAFHPGASDPAKRWPENRFAELADALIEQYQAKIVIIGASDTDSIAKRIISLSKNEAVNLAGKTSVGQLAGLLMGCDLLVSNDSGPVHVAAGVGTPVISIFTRNQAGINPERWGPLGEKSRVVSVLPVRSSGISFKKAQPRDIKYLELVPAKAVLEAVDSLFKLC
ncbi:MAG: lipopolysaccharide heptosyltransferase II [Candidatus Omnitrophica bacterium]|nr:lipopolysaccharide heptosyltransferase II [Candidatus Omnitrophota bacterium]